jgi:hypothetical protein
MNDEARMTNVETISKHEARNSAAELRHSIIRNSFVLGHSVFVIFTS